MIPPNTEADEIGYGSVLLVAIANKEIEIVKKLINTAFLGRKYPPHNSEKGGNTIVHTALLTNDSNIIELVLNSNADLVARNATDESPILLAAKKGNWDAVSLLIKKLGDTNQSDHLQYAKVIEIAKDEGKHAIISELIPHCHKSWLVKISEEESIVSALHLALIQNQDQKTIITLINDNTSLLTRRNLLNQTPFVLANATTLDMLIEKYALMTDENDHLQYGACLLIETNSLTEELKQKIVCFSQKASWVIKNKEGKLTVSKAHYDITNNDSSHITEYADDDWQNSSDTHLPPMAHAAKCINDAFIKAALKTNYFATNYDTEKDPANLRKAYVQAAESGCSQDTLDELNTHSKFDEHFVEEFKKVYEALYKAQSSFLKTHRDWSKADIAAIKKYVNDPSNSNSRSAIAYKITTNFIKTGDEQALVRRIHNVGYKASSTFGLFKHSKHEDGLETDFKGTCKKAQKNNNSRTADILNALKMKF